MNEVKWVKDRYVVTVNGVEHSRWKNPTPAQAIALFGPEKYTQKDLQQMQERDQRYPNE